MPRLGELFTTDGCFFDVCGHAALEAACMRAANRTDPDRDQIHAQSNTLLVQLDTDRIHGLTNVVFGTHQMGQGGTAHYSGYGDYHDVFVRTADGWRFQSRRACSHLSEPLPPEFL